MSGPCSSLRKNGHRANPPRLPPRDGESPCFLCETDILNNRQTWVKKNFSFVHFPVTIFHVCLHRWVSTRPTAQWSTRTQPCTWRAGMDTPGSTILTSLYPRRGSNLMMQGRGRAAPGRDWHQCPDSSRNGSPRGGTLWKGFTTQCIALATQTRSKITMDFVRTLWNLNVMCSWS